MLVEEDKLCVYQKKEKLRFGVKTGIMGLAAAEKKPVLVTDIYQLRLRCSAILMALAPILLMVEPNNTLRDISEHILKDDESDLRVCAAFTAFADE